MGHISHIPSEITMRIYKLSRKNIVLLNSHVSPNVYFTLQNVDKTLSLFQGA